MAQDPQPGAQVVRGTAIHLLQSLGPYEGIVAMPDVRGREMVAAVNLLKDLQIEATVVFQQTASRGDRVVAQDPPPGQRIAVGSRARITVGE